ncbi:MAG: ATP-binding protein [Candidatus Altiarchaeota archaeon]|nr:ATP-binding protein [Candidatus Altiarchaeota archaeon]
MRITKVKTSAFAISKGEEKKLTSKKQDDIRIKLHRRYLPLGKIKTVKTKGVSKGALRREKTSIIRNYIYVDLSHLNIYYVGVEGILRPQPVIKKTDILRRSWDFTPQMLNTLNYVWERGSVLYDGLNRDIVIDLARLGFVVVYESGDSQIFNLLKIATDERMIPRYSVKPRFYIPKYGDRRYNLSSFLEVVGTVDSSYRIDPIRHSIKKIEKTVSYLFNCDAQLEGITYLPYIVSERAGSGDADAVFYYPICPMKSTDIKKKYDTETKLAPISLSTELYEGDSVPIEKSSISFSDIGGLQEAKREIVEAIIFPLIRPDLSKKFGRKSGGGILLYGPPGCGKSQIAKAAVTECGVSFFNVNVSDIMNEKGEEAKKLHEVFEKANNSTPAIIFFDEIDALCSRKSSQDESKRKVLNQFLMDMDGVERLSEGLLIIAATNIPWELDPALRRAGRLTKQIFIPPPDLVSRAEIFKICTRNKPLSKDIDFMRLAELTEGYSGADIAEICNTAASIPWKDAVYGESERAILMSDFLTAIKKQKSSLITWSLSAEGLIRESKEEELYRDLLNLVERINKLFTPEKKEQQ